MEPNQSFVRVSPRDAHYFELTDGTPYIPIGFDLVGSPKEEEIPGILAVMAANRINYCRIWASHGVWDVEHEKSGVYDEARAKVLDRFLSEAGRQGIRVKVCLEHLRDIPAEKASVFNAILHNRANGGPFSTMEEFLNSPAGIAQFTRKLEFYRGRYGDCPTVFAWELWNEVNCVNGDWMKWTRTMLPIMHGIFPKNMVVQSLGSFDNAGSRQLYAPLCALAGNDAAQVHRYLDLGAKLEICHAPLDLLTSDAVRELRSFNTGKPVILAETGAVKPHHAGASELYALDRDGMMLHDMLFAPFFAGAAGTGHPWFWRQNIQQPNHWHHFARFAAAVEGVDPPAEGFEPVMLDHERLRVYVLKGKTMLLAWCRDAHNDWQSELVQGNPPEELNGLTLDLSALIKDATIKTGRAYDPWNDAWTNFKIKDGRMALPAFKRSVVIRLDYKPKNPKVK